MGKPDLDDEALYEPDTMRIMVATDIHLGYMEKDAVRGNDSIEAFEEILSFAKKHDVDFILLGGDLFHDNKPSRYVLHKAMALLRKYCLGDKPVEVELLSDQSVNFGHTPFAKVNYEDPNLNISIPVFSVHGNHDDPAGQGNLCSLDLLSAAGLVNYFGKYTSLEKIEISPLLLQKGQTKLALYGLGSIRDERLHRMFLHKNVTMLRPREKQDEWYNIFVLHQNRAKHGVSNYIPEAFLDEFIDTVIWGHEHECKIRLASNGTQRIRFCQPGSSVATSLSEGETKPKHVGILCLNKGSVRMEELKLQTVRQFYMEDIALSDTSLSAEDPNCAKKVMAYCVERAESLIDKAEMERTGETRRPDKPLIRLRVDYSGGFEPFNIHRFGQKFVDRVANPKDIVLFNRRREQNTHKGGAKCGDFSTLDVGLKNETALDSSSVEDMVKSLFSQADEKQQLALLTERGMGEAVKEFVEKEEKDAIPELVKYQIQKTQEYLRKRSTTEDIIDQDILRYREERKKNAGEEDTEVEEALSLSRTKKTTRPSHTFHDDSDGDGASVVHDLDSDDASTTSSRGRGRGRGSRGGRGGRGSRGESQSGRGSRGGRGGRGRAKEPVVQDIRSAMFSSSQKSKRSYINSSDEDIIDDSDDMVSKKKKSSTATPTRSSQKKGMRRGVDFESDDDIEEIRPVKRRR